MDSLKQHWERVHAHKAPTERSWFQRTPSASLRLIEAANIAAGARVIDVGGGTSRLVDVLIDRGFRDLTVLDISGAALAEIRERLGASARHVTFVESNVTEAHLEGPYGLWHDRAVFHFLTDAADRRRYVELLHGNLAPGGHAIIATFAEDGPERCSGLAVIRCSAEALAREVGGSLELVSTEREIHVTPAGAEQRFVYCLFRQAR